MNGRPYGLSPTMLLVVLFAFIVFSTADGRVRGLQGTPPLCKWQVGVGSSLVDPSQAPDGTYIVQCFTGADCSKVAKALARSQITVKVLRSLGIITGQFTRDSLNKLCRNSELSSLIDMVELDQPVLAGSDLIQG